MHYNTAVIRQHRDYYCMYRGGGGGTPNLRAAWEICKCVCCYAPKLFPERRNNKYNEQSAPYKKNLEKS